MFISIYFKLLSSQKNPASVFFNTIYHVIVYPREMSEAYYLASFSFFLQKVQRTFQKWTFIFVLF